MEEKNLSLIGKLLFFSPSEREPSYFTNSLIFICEHSQEGAIGVIINRQIDLKTDNLLKGVGLNTQNLLSPKHLLIGGPVNPGSVFVLHSSEKEWESTLKITKDVSLSTSKDTLEDIAKNKTPKEYLITLQHALDCIEKFSPDALVIALGLDAYEKDPLQGFSITTGGFKKIGREIGGTMLPTVIVQEGGYVCPELGVNLSSFLEGFIIGRKI